MSDDVRKKRKDQHLRLALSTEGEGAGLKDIQLRRPALPETSVDLVDTSVNLFGKHLNAPLLIEAMTGGTEWGKRINSSLSSIASRLGIGFALGSGTVIAEDKEAEASFRIARENNRQGLVLANCSPTTPIETIERLIEITEADALQIHLNAVQEALMPEGDRDFRWMDRIASILSSVSVPVIIKEVGFGLDRESIQKLIQTGVSFFDLGGRGGTDFARIENNRSERDFDVSGVGLSTAQSLIDMRSMKNPDITYIASGGIRTPLDALKCMALGASAVGIASPVLKVLDRQGEAACEAYLKEFISQLRLLMAIHGVSDVPHIKDIGFTLKGDLYTYAAQIEKMDK